MGVVHRKASAPHAAGITGHVRLRKVRKSDIPIFFENQLDPGASWMAAFGNIDSSKRVLYETRWAESLRNPGADWKAVLVDGTVVGYVGVFPLFGKPSVAYWISRAVWGRGVATRALEGLLRAVATRPLFARVAGDNLGSIRVLEKCGFAVVGREKSLAEIRGEEIEELVLRLDQCSQVSVLNER